MRGSHTVKRVGSAYINRIPIHKKLIKALPVDVRIVGTWDADLTDIDLWVLEPTKEKAYYDNRLTSIGGHMSADYTDGYGPEEYCLKRAKRGTYKVQANFYGSSAQTLSGAVTIRLELYTNYGRRNERRRVATLRLNQESETVTVGVLEF